MELFIKRKRPEAERFFSLISMYNLIASEWEEKHRVSIVEAPVYKWDKPSIKQLYDRTIDMLVNMYPETIPVSLTLSRDFFSVDKMAEIYKRAHGVLVNPVELYCKDWDDLVQTTFKDKLQLTPNKVF